MAFFKLFILGILENNGARDNQSEFCVSGKLQDRGCEDPREREVAGADFVSYFTVTEVVLEMVNFAILVEETLEVWKNFINLTIIYLHTHIQLTRWFNSCHHQ